MTPEEHPTPAAVEETIVGAIDKEGGMGADNFVSSMLQTILKRLDRLEGLPKSQGSQPNSGRRVEPVTCRKDTMPVGVQPRGASTREMVSP